MVFMQRFKAGDRTLAVWLSLLVIFWGLLAPALNHAIASRNAEPLGAEICTSAGLRFVTFAADSPHENKGLKTHVTAFDHCPFCLHQAGHVALPPNPFAYLFLDLGGIPVPMALQAFFYTQDSRLWAPPRGPPALLQG